MIDNLSLAITHGLMVYAMLHMISRPDLDIEKPDIKGNDKSAATDIAKIHAERKGA